MDQRASPCRKRVVSPLRSIVRFVLKQFRPLLLCVLLAGIATNAGGCCSMTASTNASMSARVMRLRSLILLSMACQFGTC